MVTPPIVMAPDEGAGLAAAVGSGDWDGAEETLPAEIACPHAASGSSNRVSGLILVSCGSRGRQTTRPSCFDFLKRGTFVVL